MVYKGIDQKHVHSNLHAENEIKSQNDAIRLSSAHKTSKRAGTIVRLLLSFTLITSLVPIPSIAWALPEPKDEKMVAQEKNEEAENEPFDEVADLGSEPLAVTQNPDNQNINSDNEDLGSSGSGDIAYMLNNDVPILESTHMLATPAATTDWNGRTYTVYIAGAQWDTADAFCREQGGHLVTITSAEEGNIVGSLLRYTSPYIEGVWMGLYQSEGQWRWVTNENYSYSNFAAAPVSPQSNSKGVFYATQGYTERRDDSGNTIASWPVGQEQWSFWSEPTWSPTWFVCEWENTYDSPGLSIDPGVVQFMWGDPVDLSAGAQVVDLSYLDQTAQMPFTFDLSYRSDMLTPGEMGRGWHHNYEKKLKLHEGVYRYCPSPSSYVEFEPTNVENVYKTNASGRKNWVLTRITPSGANPYFELNCGYDEILLFDVGGGPPFAIKNRTGDHLMFSYSSQTTTITDNTTGCALVLTYNFARQLIEARIKDSDTSVSFAYDSKGNLASIKDPLQKTFKYYYDDKGRIVTGIDPDNIVCLFNQYDAQGRVIHQDDAIDDGAFTTFAYEFVEGGQTIVTVKDREENMAEFVFDRDKHLLSKTDQDG